LQQTRQIEKTQQQQQQQQQIILPQCPHKTDHNKAIANKSFLMRISWQRKYRKKIKIFLNLSFLCLFVSVSPEEHTECPLILRMTRDGISTVVPSMVK